MNIKTNKTKTHRFLISIFLSFIIVFSPIYAYAVLPVVLGTAATTGGRVLAGQVVRKFGQGTLGRAAKFCVAHPTACTLGTGIATALLKDGWEIEVNIDNSDTTNNDIDIEIYQFRDEVCELETMVGQYSGNVPTHDTYQDYYNDYIQQRNAETDNEKVNYRSVDNYDEDAIATIEQLKSGEKKVMNDWRFYSNFEMPLEYTINDGKRYNTSTLRARLYYRCLPYDSNKIYLTDNEMAQYVYNYGDANDILNIYNYDYSQHQNITINQQSYSGDTINNNVKNSPKEFEVSPELSVEIENDNISMDDINDENCSKDLDGVYDKCFDIPKPDDNKDDDEKCPEGTKLVNANECKPIDDDENNNDDEKEPPPIECDSNGFNRKICDWMDWSQEEHTPDDDTQVPVTDLSEGLEIDENKINFNDQCPAPKNISLTVAGQSFGDELDYQPMCDFFSKLKPFVVGLGGISSALIIAGGARRG